MDIFLDSYWLLTQNRPSRVFSLREDSASNRGNHIQIRSWEIVAAVYSKKQPSN
ncbi:MAG: hypothetical protein V7K40_19685 [Nostoc sp.]